MNPAPMKKMSKRGSVAFIILACCVFFIIPIYFILTGLWKITDCPATIRVPLWMIFFGVLIIIERCLYWKRLVNETKFERTFPRPSFGSTERMRTWEKNRLSSSSKTVLFLITSLRNVILITIICGMILSFDFTFHREKAGECSELLTWSVFIVSAFSLFLWAFALLGTLYIHFVHSLQNFENTAGASLNRVIQ